MGPSLPADVMAKMVAYLKSHGVRTSIHATKEDAATAAVEAGIDVLSHPVSVARVNPSFTAMLAERCVPVATTLAVFDEIIRFGEDPTVIDTPLNQFVMGAGAGRPSGQGAAALCQHGLDLLVQSALAPPQRERT